ncbi:MAG: hypothetical protein QOF02_3019 [Blastocatellia bacterium]|nr:hypothetical protein [Blastocatellia bacterium]
MSELDETWARAVAEAERRARGAGRKDVAEYLSLRASNDLARSAGIDWLLSTLITLAGEANRAGASIQQTRADAHRFSVGSATMVGTLLTFTAGVRRLSIEAGWPREPRDGFVRGNGLASGHIKHFGLRGADDSLLLVRPGANAPQWVVLEKTGERSQLTEARMRRHLERFLGAS